MTSATCFSEALVTITAPLTEIQGSMADGPDYLAAHSQAAAVTLDCITKQL